MLDLDKVDIAILGALKAEDRMTTTDIAKRLSEDGSPVQDRFKGEDTRQEMKNRENRVRHRLKPLVEEGLVSALNGTKKNYYFLNRALVQFGDGKLALTTEDGKVLEAEVGRVIAIWDGQGNIALIELGHQ